jgi:hypothetical protein
VTNYDRLNDAFFRTWANPGGSDFEDEIATLAAYS